MVNRLEEDIQNPRRQAPVFVFRQITGSDRDYRDMLRLVHAPEPTQEQESIPRDATAVCDVGREIQVQEDQVRPRFAEDANGARTVLRSVDFVSEGPQLVGGHLQDQAVVIDHQNLFGGFRISLAGAAGLRALA